MQWQGRVTAKNRVRWQKQMEKNDRKMPSFMCQVEEEEPEE